MAVTIPFFFSSATVFKAKKTASSASGQGTIALDYMNFEPQQFSFHALKDVDGSVTGSWESNSPGQDCRTHGTITCLTILPDGKTAIMSGEITQVEGTCFGSTVGSPIWFKVQDNGEGSKAAPDGFTDYYFGLSGCTDYGLALHPIIGGNIQVKP